MTPRNLLATVAAFALVVATFTSMTVAADAGPAHHVMQIKVKKDRDCGSFPSQAAAQRYFVAHGGPRSDPDGLDADSDGIACETNPCPCSMSTGPGPGPNPGPTRPPLVVQRGNVIRVIDGDTVDVRLRNDDKVRVRLLGIDTPEVYGGTQCGGPAASKAAKKLMPVGSRVKIVSDRSQDLRDRYGRLLRYVIRKGYDINQVQVQYGNARVYVYQHHPFNRVRAYRSAQAKAQRHDRGLWGHCR